MTRIMLGIYCFRGTEKIDTRRRRYMNRQVYNPFLPLNEYSRMYGATGFIIMDLTIRKVVTRSVCRIMWCTPRR